MGPEDVLKQLQQIELALQHLESLCRADQRLTYAAALYGASFLVEMAQFWVNQSVDLVHTDEEICVRSRAWASRMNRDAECVQAFLVPHTEELLERPLRIETENLRDTLQKHRSSQRTVSSEAGECKSTDALETQYASEAWKQLLALTDDNDNNKDPEPKICPSPKSTSQLKFRAPPRTAT